ncbi:hypothetical protein [Demequina litorisediminis]|uniref:hypothetical protein n=1 Tax=Demequina litorisediminis TaxID=1849022 RepID=UPI0024E05FD3|nr:hypothetical protein [Demequina litorisediminis]
MTKFRNGVVMVAAATLAFSLSACSRLRRLDRHPQRRGSERRQHPHRLGLGPCL